MPPSSVDELVRPNRTAPGCHLYFGAQDTEIHPGTIILLGGDDPEGHNTFQTAFSKAKNTTIHGGFYGINATEDALEYATSVAAAGALQHLASRKEALNLRRQKLAEMKCHQLASTNTKEPRAQKWLDSSLSSNIGNTLGYPPIRGMDHSQSNGPRLYKPSHAPTYADSSLPQNRNMNTSNWPDVYKRDNQTGRRASAWGSQSLPKGATFYQSQNYSSAPHPRRQMYDNVKNAELPMAQGRGEASNPEPIEPGAGLDL